MKYFLITFSLFIGSYSLSQIIMEEKTTTPQNSSPENVEKTNKETKGVEIYIGMSPTYTFRTLKENDGLFSKPLGYREQEKGTWVSSYFIGARNPLNDFLKLDLGVGFSINKEVFDFSSTDSIFKYENSYRHFAIPIKLVYSYGDKISFYGGIGLMPKAFLSMKNTVTVYDQFKNEKTETTVHKDNFNLFLLDAVADIGIQLKLNKNAGFYLLLEGRRQLTNNYSQQSPYIRKAFAVGLNFGLEFYL